MAERNDYVVELKTIDGKTTRMLIKGKDRYTTHILALREVARFMLLNNVVKIRVYECKGYFCDEVKIEIDVEGVVEDEKQ